MFFEKRHTKKIKQQLKGKDAGTLVANFFSLFVLQVLNVVLPFLTVPYLIHIFGLEKYGLLSFAHTLVLFFVVFAEYGFNTSTTRDISIHSNNKEEVQRIFNDVFTTKLFLLLILALLFTVLIFSIPVFEGNELLYFFYFGIVVGYTLFPVWLFHGLQKMKYITYVNVFFKSLFTICIFLFVKERADILYVPVFLSLGSVTAGLASLFISRFTLGIYFRFSSFKAVIVQLKKGWHLFMSEFYMALMAFSNVLILGFLFGSAGERYVGIYTAAEKIIRAAGSLLSPVINALYPFVTRLFLEKSAEAARFIRKTQNWGILIILSGTVFVFIFADWLFAIIFSDKEGSILTESVWVFRMMILFPLFSFLDQLYGKLVLITTGKSNLFFKVFTIGASLNFVGCFVLSYYFTYKGAALSSALSQGFIAIAMYYYARPVLTMHQPTKPHQNAG